MQSDLVSTRVAAKILGISLDTMYWQMEHDELDIGRTAHSKGKATLHYVYRGKLERVIGRELTDEEMRG